MTLAQTPSPRTSPAPDLSDSNQEVFKWTNLLDKLALEARTLWDTVEQLSACDRGLRSDRLDRSWYGMVGFSRLYCTLGGSAYTAPTVGPIHFMNRERTRAHAVVTTGMDAGGGYAAVVEKVDGEWKVTGSAGSWVY